jgi:hypothetical protein
MRPRDANVIARKKVAVGLCSWLRAGRSPGRQFRALCVSSGLWAWLARCPACSRAGKRGRGRPAAGPLLERGVLCALSVGGGRWSYDPVFSGHTVDSLADREAACPVFLRGREAGLGRGCFNPA